MVNLIFIGAAFIGGIAGSIAILVRVTAGKRLSLSRGLAIVIASCFAWHALAWVGLSGSSGFFHRILFLSVIVPFGFGFGQGTRAAVVAITIQAVLVAAFASVLHWR